MEPLRRQSQASPSKCARRRGDEAIVIIFISALQSGAFPPSSLASTAAASVPPSSEWLAQEPPSQCSEPIVAGLQLLPAGRVEGGPSLDGAVSHLQIRSWSQTKPTLQV